MPCERTRGFRFKEGKLYVFHAAGVIILESWPTLRAVRKDDGKPWQEFAPVSRVVRPYRPRKVKPAAAPVAEPQLELALGVVPKPPPDHSIAAQRKRAFDQFRFSMPKPAAAVAEKYQSRQWNVLRLFQARHEALEFAAQNPALCYALANFRHFDNTRGLQRFEDVVKTSGMRQRDIAGALGFPPTDGAARVLAKLAPESASVPLLDAMQRALTDAAVAKTLSHLPKLNTGAVSIVIDEQLRTASTPRLLAEVSETATEKYRADIAMLIGETLHMYFHVHPNRGTPQLQSIARLREIHNEVSTDYLRAKGDALRSIRFPKPPVPGTPEIVPICTVEDLIEEGRVQNNCVATYAERVRAGRTFIYRVLKPVRATLSIVRGMDGTWEISELERGGNSGASNYAWDAVQSWLDEHISEG